MKLMQQEQGSRKDRWRLVLLGGVMPWILLASACSEPPNYGQALDLQSEGKYQEAIKAWSKLQKKDPDDWFVYAYRSKCYLYVGEYQYAKDDFDRAIELDPRNFKLYRERAAFLASCKAEGFRDGKQALQDIDQAFALYNPDRILKKKQSKKSPFPGKMTGTKDLYAVRAMVLAENGDFEGAVSAQELHLQAMRSGYNSGDEDKELEILQGYKNRKPFRSEY